MPMRTVDEKTPDALRRKITAVLGEPIALRQTLLDNVEQLASHARGGKRQPDFGFGIQHEFARIGFDPPQRRVLSFCLSRLECGHRAGQLVEHCGHFQRRFGALYLGRNANGICHLLRGRGRADQARWTKASMTFLSPACSKLMSSRLSSILRIVP